MIFLLKCSVFDTLSMDKVSMSHLISFSRYQTKRVIKFLFRQMMTSETFKIFLESTSKVMADREKRGEDGNKKHFLFLKGYHLVNNIDKK